MAAIVQIDQPVTTPTLEAGGSQVAVGFDVVNIADRHLHLVATIVPAHGATEPLPDWLTINGEQSLRLGPSETKKVTLRLAPPATAASCDTPFRLKVYEVSLPEENNGFSEPVRVTVTAAPPVVQKRPWKPIAAIAAALVLLVAAGGWFAYDRFAGKPLPNVEGETLEAAREALTEAGLPSAGIVLSEPFARDADGTVTKQEPAAGTPISADTVVTLTVPRQPEMPDLVELTLDGARAALVDAGIDAAQVGIERAIGREAGRIIGQAPAAGTRLEPEAVVTLTLSALGMPLVVGAPLEAALTALEEAGIARAAVTVDRPVSRRDAEKVVEQTLGPGTLLEIDDAVRLEVPRQPEMPNVVGHAQATALERLAAAGIPRAEVQIDRPIERNADLSVTRQSPSTGTRIGPATTVLLTVPRRPGTLTLPRLASTATGEAAMRSYRAAGLAVDLIEDRNAPGREPGRVIEVLPPPGSAVEETATIEVRVQSTTVNVPQFEGRDITAAERARLDRYFNVNQVVLARSPGASGRFAKDCVVDQSHAGEVRRGTTITIKISVFRSSIDAIGGCPRVLSR